MKMIRITRVSFSLLVLYLADLEAAEVTCFPPRSRFATPDLDNISFFPQCSQLVQTGKIQTIRFYEIGKDPQIEPSLSSDDKGMRVNDCQRSIRDIQDRCQGSTPAAFWGGWMVENSVNYTIFLTSTDFERRAS